MNRDRFGWTQNGAWLRIRRMTRKIYPCSGGVGWMAAAVLPFLAAIVFAPAQPVVSPANAPSSTNSPVAPSPIPRRPGIVLIVADDLGYGELGCYGQTRIKTPNLDKLAAEGMRFTSFYAGSTICAPSRCSLMTGLHTGHGLVRGNTKIALRAEDRTFAQILQDGGYQTCMVGKWALGDEGSDGLPQKKGFAECLGYLDQTLAHNYYPDHLYHNAPKTAVGAGFDGQQFQYENADGKKQLYSHDLFTKAALNFVRINRPDRFNYYRPFFLYLAYTIPHANNEEGRRTGNGMEVPTDAPYAGESWPQPEKNKAAMITRLDADIGRLMEQMAKFQMDKDTIVIFTSDNGPHKEGGVDPKFFQSAGPLRGIKRDLYEGGIRVPLIVRWPARVKAGAVCDTPWAFWDFMPTAADIAYQKPPEGIDGISFLPTLLGAAQTNQHQFLYWEFHENGFQQAARMGDWKAVRLAAGKPLELYNLKTDPGEKQDVAERNPRIIAAFEEYFKTARTDSPLYPIKPAGASTDSTNAPN